MRLCALAAMAGCAFQPGSVATDGARAGSDANGSGLGSDAPSGVIDASPNSGVLTLASATVPDGDTNLTTEGTTDWAHWSYPNQTTTFNHLASGNVIANVTETASFVVVSSPMTFSWTGGSPNGTVLQTGTAISINTGSGPTALHFNVDAGLTTRTLRLYVGVKAATARLDASLSDSSATPVTDTQTTASVLHLVYTITFRAAATNRTLDLVWTDTNDQSSQGYAALYSATVH